MENLALLIYLCSMADALLILCGAIIFVCIILVGSGVLIRNEATCIGEVKAVKYWDGVIRKSIISGVICALICIIVPSKKTCYQIMGVIAAVELYQNSDALRQLPEKSFEALNRLLDSIAADDREEL